MEYQTQHYRQNKPFIYDNTGVIDLPLKLIVSLAISAAVIISIVSFMNTMPLPPSKIQVIVTPIMDIINETKNMTIFHVRITDSIHKKPIQHGLVTIKGYNILAYNQTNKTGECQIPIQFNTAEGINELYLDVTVKANGYERYNRENMIRIIIS